MAHRPAGLGDAGGRAGRAAQARARAAQDPDDPPPPTYSLLPGSPDLAGFPRAQWLAAARRALMTAPYEAFELGEARGRVELRTALADYLARARGVYADPGRIVICSGAVHGLMLLGTVLRARGCERWPSSRTGSTCTGTCW